MTFTEILKYVVLENTVKDWGIALGIVLGSFIATKIMYWIIANVVKNLTKKTKTNLDDVLIETLEKPIIYSILIWGYWIAIHYLDLSGSPRLLFFLQGIANISIILTLTSIVSRVFDALVSEVVHMILRCRRSRGERSSSERARYLAQKRSI